MRLHGEVIQVIAVLAEVGQPILKGGRQKHCLMISER